MPDKHTVILQPSGRRGEFSDGTGLRAAARQLGMDLESVCAENGTCGKCKVIVEEGTFAAHGIASGRDHLTAPAPQEAAYFAARPKLLAGRGRSQGQLRLACQARICGDVVITVPEESLVNKQIVRKSASGRRIEIRPSIRKYLVELNPPTLLNPKGDWERLASGIATSIGLVRHGEPGLPGPHDLGIDYACLRTLSGTLRAAHWRVTASVWQDREVIRVEPGLSDRLFGAAVDIGSTTLALYLCDLEDGSIVATESDMNPQIAHGEDVLSRIQFAAANPGGLQQLHGVLIQALNELLGRAAGSAGIATDDILEMTVVGNTTMQHLFLNLPVQSLGVAPFAAGLQRPVDIKARELGLTINASANVHVLPAIASFVGADTTGALLAEEPQRQAENWLIIDIGTNAELVLGNETRLICTSTPTGPAFEGAHIEYGMRAAPGAIEHIKIDAQSLEPRCKIIGQDAWGRGRARGLCGSGIIDGVAELFRTGVVDERGRFLLEGGGSGRIRRGAHGLEYVIAPADETCIGRDIVLTQQDVREIQLAKAALFVAARTLLNQFGLQAPDKILLAGAFGSYVDQVNAMLIGMLPDCPLENVHAVGNSAGDGARIALLNVEKRREAIEFAARVRRFELPADPAFQQQFLQAMYFPHRREPFPHIAHLLTGRTRTEAKQ
jgi:uncharacterized 2Fe-2S/4Fe-4S cluster protein (DUF4445 family)